MNPVDPYADPLRSTEYETNEAGMRLHRCRTCALPVLLAQENMTGRHVLLEAEPSADGDVGIEDRGQGRLIALRFRDRDLIGLRAQGRPLHREHPHG